MRLMGTRGSCVERSGKKVVRSERDGIFDLMRNREDLVKSMPYQPPWRCIFPREMTLVVRDDPKNAVLKGLGKNRGRPAWVSCTDEPMPLSVIGGGKTYTEEGWR